MALFILMVFYLLLKIQSSDSVPDLPQAKLTIFPQLVTIGEMVQMNCGGYNKQSSECMFYPAGLENLKLPSPSCNHTLNSTDLITWSRKQEPSHVYITCYYTVFNKSGDLKSLPSNEVSVEIRAFPVHLSTETLPPPSTAETSLAETSRPETTVGPTIISTSVQLTTLTKATKPAKSDSPKIKKIKNTTMILFITVVATSGGILLTGFMGICLYKCTRKPKKDRIWIEPTKKKRGVSLPIVTSDSSVEEFYSTIDDGIIPSAHQPPVIVEEQSKQTEQTEEVELNPLYYTIFTQPVVSSDTCKSSSLQKIL